MSQAYKNISATITYVLSIGWWLVSIFKHEEDTPADPQRDEDQLPTGSEQEVIVNNKLEKIGYMPGDFLKRRERIHLETSVEIRNTYLGLVSPAALEEIDSSLKYVAIEDYQTDDGRQMSFMEGDHLVVVDKSEDGECVCYTLVQLHLS